MKRLIGFFLTIVILTSTQSHANGDYQNTIAELNDKLESMSFALSGDESVKVVMRTGDDQHFIGVLYDTSLMREHAVVIACNESEGSLINCVTPGFYPLTDSFMRFFVEDVGGVNFPKREVLAGIAIIAFVNYTFMLGVNHYHKKLMHEFRGTKDQSVRERSKKVSNRIGSKLGTVGFLATMGIVGTGLSLGVERQFLPYLTPTLEELEEEIKFKYGQSYGPQSDSVSYPTFFRELEKMLMVLNLNYAAMFDFSPL